MTRTRIKPGSPPSRGCQQKWMTTNQTRVSTIKGLPAEVDNKKSNQGLHHQGAASRSGCGQIQPASSPSLSVNNGQQGAASRSESQQIIQGLHHHHSLLKMDQQGAASQLIQPVSSPSLWTKCQMKRFNKRDFWSLYKNRTRRRESV